MDSATRAASLQAITSALANAFTADDVARVVIELGLPGAGATAGAVGLLSADGRSLDLLRTLGYPDQMVAALRSMPLDSSTPMTEAVRTAAPAWRDATAAPETYTDYDRLNMGFGAGAGLPLMIDGVPVGAIGLSFADARALSDSERAFLNAIASQCAQAIHRVRLYQAERTARAAAERAAARTARLQNLTTVLSDSHSVDEWAPAALQQAIEAVGAKRGLIHLLTEDGSALQLIEAANVSAVIGDGGQLLPLTFGSPGSDAVVQRRPVYISDSAQLVERYPLLEGAPPVESRSCAHLPLIVGRSVLGLMTLDFEMPRTFDDEDRAFMETVAAQCGQALERARLIERERAGHEEAALLHAVAASAAGQSDLSGILNAALDQLGRFIPFTGGSIALVEGDDLVIRAARGPFATQALGQRVPRSAHVSWQIVESGQPFLSDDRQADGIAATTPIRAFLGVPLAWEERRFGMLEVDATRPNLFTQHHLELLRKVAVTVSRSVELARLYAAERAAREQLDAILAGVADGVVVQGLDGRFVYANEPAVRLAGFRSADEYLGATPADISARLTVLDEHGHTFPYEDLPARRALRGETAPEMVVQFRRDDSGTVQWSLTRSRAIRGRDGGMLAISIFHDITDHVRSEERLRFLAEASTYLSGSLDVNETLSAIARLATETLADWAVVYLDEGEDVEATGPGYRDPATAALENRVGGRHPPRPANGSRFWEVMQTGDTVVVADLSADVLDEIVGDADYVRQVREMAVTSAVYIPLVTRGRTLGTIGLFSAESGRRLGDQDRAIAEEIARRAALALDNARLYREAQNAIHARDEFLSIASHELRTPVTAISGVAQLLERARSRGALDEQRLDRALAQIAQGSKRLVTLTEDLLDVSRLQTGHFDLQLVSVDIASFLADLIERTTLQLSGETDHRIHLECATSDAVVEVDAARLEQVMANLLSNAVKYSPQGGDVRVVLNSSPDSVQIDVVDSGIGLASGSEETIFQPFGRGPNAAAQHIQGLGLGLYICRQLVQRHGGRIWAESQGEGYGTTVHVSLPRP